MPEPTIEPPYDPETELELRRRTPEERLDWLTMEVAILRAEVNQLKQGRDA